MRRILVALLVFAMFAMAAADFNGNWSGTGFSEGKSHKLYFIIKQTGAVVAGSGGPDATEQHPFQNGRITGNRISFDAMDGKAKLHFDLAFEGEGLRGTVDVDEDGDITRGTVSLKKETN